jgi:hypothetical protein
MTRFGWIPLLLGGCLVVPAARTTTRSLGMRDGQVYQDADAGLELTGEATGREVAVHATRQLDCHRDIYAVTEVHRERYLKMGGVDDPRARVVGVLIAPLTIPISAAISAVEVSDGSGTTEQVRVDHTEKLRCTRPAEGLAIELVVPSGRVLRGTVDATGVAQITLPVSEPYRGTAVARAEATTTRIAFERDKPAVSAVRDAALACATSLNKTGAVKVVVAVDETGAAFDLAIAGDPDLATCVHSAIAHVTFPPAQRASTVVLPLDLTPRG